MEASPFLEEALRSRSRVGEPRGGGGGGGDPPDSLNGHAREVTAWRRSSSTRPVLVLQ